MDAEEWERTTKTYYIELRALKVVGKENKVDLPKAVSFDLGFKAMPHQIVGAVELFINAFGARHSAILGDEMGLGKTAISLIAWDINYRGAA
jgi:SNF2 family DNA or RNA helicase